MADKTSYDTVGFVIYFEGLFVPFPAREEIKEEITLVVS